MIINKTLVSFAGRVPSPRYVPVGVVGDNLVECVEFRLPTIDEHQTATMLLNGKYADAITLERKGDIYCADITADIAGAAGRSDAYIRINAKNGAVWNSEPFILCVCNTPEMNESVEEYSLTVFDQMLKAIAEHRGEMDDTEEFVDQRAKDADEDAANAQTQAIAAANAASLAGQYRNEANNAANNAENSEAAARDSAHRSETAAGRAEQAAATNGYVFFEINESGRLIMTKTESVETIDFRMENGRLEVVYG